MRVEAMVESEASAESVVSDILLDIHFKCIEATVLDIDIGTDMVACMAVYARGCSSTKDYGIVVSAIVITKNVNLSSARHA